MRTQKGQSMVETLVALSIMVIGVLSVVTLAIYTIRMGSASQRDLIAENLAREGLEAVRWQRDFNWINGKTQTSNWRDGFTPLADDPKYLRANVFATQVDFEEIPNYPNDNTKVCFDEAMGKYVQMGDDCGPFEGTSFNRTIIIWPENGCVGSTGWPICRFEDDNSQRVTSLVTYRTEFGQQKYVTVTEELFNWFYE